MTVFAFEFRYFVQHISSPVCRDFLVASVAGQFGVFSFKREFGPGMIESRGRTECRFGMTPAAVGLSGGRKLPGMDVGVAAAAFFFHSAELFTGDSSGCHEMAGSARPARMGSDQGKCRQVMVESHAVPTRFLVAIRAG